MESEKCHLVKTMDFPDRTLHPWHWLADTTIRAHLPSSLSVPGHADRHGPRNILPLASRQSGWLFKNKQKMIPYSPADIALIKGL